MKKTTRVVVVMLCLAITIVESCSKSSEDTLSQQTPTACDTVNITYSAGVASILKANCYSCHGNGESSGGVNFDSYSNVKNWAANGALLGAVTHASGYVPMPLNEAKLSDCDINQIRSWISNGMLNN